MGELALPQDELVPLSIAASLAYRELTEVKSRLGSEEHLSDVVDLTVVALSHVAPIYWKSAEGGQCSAPMTAAQVDELLFAPIRKRGRAPDLDLFYIRQSDLHAAIGKLRSKPA